MNINTTLKDGDFRTASTSAKGIWELEFVNASPATGLYLLCVYTRMTLSALKLRETKLSFPDLSISITFFSQQAFTERLLCTAPCAKH